ncbi:hypothetical protein FRB93_005051 [Tulasnella sp. JGI-2019a]|nr:hypothetical protein FRB93_005051 [Tulasnella sp. JGI-2019a]
MSNLNRWARQHRERENKRGFGKTSCYNMLNMLRYPPGHRYSRGLRPSTAVHIREVTAWPLFELSHTDETRIAHSKDYDSLLELGIETAHLRVANRPSTTRDLRIDALGCPSLPHDVHIRTYDTPICISAHRYNGE